MVDERQRTVGVVGLGAMGLPAALAFGAHGPVIAHDASGSARRRAGSAGVTLAADLAELAQSANTVVLSLPDAGVVEDVVREICPQAPGLLVLDTSTIGPEEARHVAEVAHEHGSTYLDTPVLGRPESVGEWTVPMGGPASAHAAVSRILAPIAAKVVHVGDVGSAATLKVVNNLMFSVINAVTAEALLLAEVSGLDPQVFVDTVLGSGAATVSGLFRSVAPRAVAGDFNPIFSLDLVRKDNDLAVTLAASAGLSLDVGQAARDLHDRAVAAGYGEQDSIAVLRYLLDERASSS